MEKKVDENFFVCPYCGGRMIWGTSESASELSDIYADDDFATVDFYTCETCGRYFEILEPCEEDRKGMYAKYWYGDRESVS